MSTPVLVRPAVAADLPAIAAVYDHQVRTGVATFDLEPQGTAYWEQRLAGLGPGDHLLVAEEDGEVLGYAAASPYRPRPAYRHAREVSVHLADTARGRGVGSALYDDLLARLRADGVHTALAVVALPNPASRALHRRCGFEPVGVLREVGFKHERWIDTELWQLMLR
ncbi:GNAT family N-acetyltransferase [Nocardioides sp. zg-579]|uniref:GNAT family N-acetyltransferase n=1 Tax=Nocardioides marmotae TaxID=2663857 RepID=A0A6I3JEJ1_9ACTN|nr:GNAT family N-acetyltransferase [Nocardioides marmotae]MCR6032975.1 GNAT family N-acetyltransferase [Gordonia jinghuaiqii]MTB96626.1 GNAT family N-acetyltransferase [Nocardioides marmotae]QKE01863.1 N-acetyltransferase [Nocardioides marmotae]